MDIRKIEIMLDEYVNQRLSNKNMEKVETYMNDYKNVDTEVKFLKKLRYAVKNEALDSPAHWGLTRLRRSLPSHKASTKRTSSWWKPLAVAASFAFILQTSFMLFNKNNTDDGYIPLSTPTAEDTIQIIFNKNITEAQIRKLLIDLDASIISGPSAIGVYRITTDSRENVLNTLQNNEWVNHAEFE